MVSSTVWKNLGKEEEKVGPTVRTYAPPSFGQVMGKTDKDLRVVGQVSNKHAKFQKLSNEGQRDGVTLAPHEAEYLQSHFTMMIVGGPGSGKSYLIRQLLENNNFYKDKFDEIFAISPSVTKLQLRIPPTHQATWFSLDWLFDQVNYLNDMQLVTLNQIFGKVYSKKYMQEPLMARYGDPLEKKARMTKGAALIGEVAGMQPYGKIKGGPSKFSREGFMRGIQSAGTTNQRAVSSLYTRVDFRQRQQFAEEQIKKAEEHRECNNAYISEGDASTYLMMLDPEIKARFHKNILVILDDVVGEIKKQEYNPRLAQLFMNRRHLIVNGTISIIVVSQKYSLIPTRIRSNATWMVLFKLNPADFKFVYQDAVTFSWKTWENVIEYVFGNNSHAQTQRMAITQNKSAIDVIKGKRFDNLGIWVEYGILFKNFEKLTID